jgi:hypothetical protein
MGLPLPAGMRFHPPSVQYLPGPKKGTHGRCRATRRTMLPRFFHLQLRYSREGLPALLAQGDEFQVACFDGLGQANGLFFRITAEPAPGQEPDPASEWPVMLV